MNNRLLVPQKLPLLLDFAPGAAAAYSLRSLSNSYTGPVVTVRRSTDNAEADFTATEVSDGTLAAWCGGGDGFVKTWHDQSLNNRDATQTTAGYQPKIVASGVLVTEGGKPALSFDGTDDALYSGTTDLAIGLAASIFCVARDTYPATGQTSAWLTVKPSANPSSAAAFELGVYNHANFRIRHNPNSSGTATDTFSTSGISLGDLSLMVAIKRDTTALLGYEEGVQVVNTAVADNNPIVLAGGVAIGRHSNTVQYAKGNACELIIYPTDMTALRTRIEGNMNRHFGVF